MQKHYPFSKIVCFFEIVSREEDGAPELSLVLHRRPKVPASAWIHTGSRLVNEVPRVLFLGICLDFYYSLLRVLLPK
ncbi:hypothetical protein, partial [Corynebacterium accolens]|uniref:hypothetical protein n=1 Tax=Corynebacterium accolens TaxID=38284 RepID=UPI002549EEC6